MTEAIDWMTESKASKAAFAKTYAVNQDGALREEVMLIWYGVWWTAWQTCLEKHEQPEPE